MNSLDSSSQPTAPIDWTSLVRSARSAGVLPELCRLLSAQSVPADTSGRTEAMRAVLCSGDLDSALVLAAAIERHATLADSELSGLLSAIATQATVLRLRDFIHVVRTHPYDEARVAMLRQALDALSHMLAREEPGATLESVCRAVDAIPLHVVEQFSAALQTLTPAGRELLLAYLASRKHSMFIRTLEASTWQLLDMHAHTALAVATRLLALRDAQRLRTFATDFRLVRHVFEPKHRPSIQALLLSAAREDPSLALAVLRQLALQTVNGSLIAEQRSTALDLAADLLCAVPIGNATEVADAAESVQRLGSAAGAFALPERVEAHLLAARVYATGEAALQNGYGDLHCWPSMSVAGPWRAVLPWR